MRVIGIVPARGGSKGIPRKNIRMLEGKPLLAYTAEAALAARLLSRVILSTEDSEIAEVGRQYGLDVPFLRPPQLALDETPTLPVVQHAVRALEEQGDRYDAVCLLQPTNPLRRGAHIDDCIELLEKSGATSAISVLPVPCEHNPHWVFFQGEDGALRLSTGEDTPIPSRQKLPPAFHREGSVYVTLRDTVMLENSLYGKKIVGYTMDGASSVNIDGQRDWEIAVALIRRLNRGAGFECDRAVQPAAMI